MTNKMMSDQQVKRLAMLQAKKLFIQKRYSSITMDEIAKGTGITKSTLYSHFPSKLALFMNVFDENLQYLYKLLVKAAKQDLPTGELIKAIFDALFIYTKKNQKFMRLYSTLDSHEFNGVIPDELTNKIRSWTRAMFDVGIEIIKRGQREGIIQEYDPELLIHLLAAMNKGILVHTNKASKFRIADIDPDGLYRIILDMMVSGLFKTTNMGAMILRQERRVPNR